MLKRYEEALATYERVLQLDPKDAEACFYRGVTLEGLGRFREAIEAFEETVRLDPKRAAECKIRIIQAKLLWSAIEPEKAPPVKSGRPFVEEIIEILQQAAAKGERPVAVGTLPGTQRQTQPNHELLATIDAAA
jgi:tetratricopeptide (TPR) repeat protein